jgi:hypothetical protein
MVFATMLAALCPAAAVAFAVQLGSVAIGAVSHQEGEPKPFKTESNRTGKERLGGKWSDEQRVDNCNVPLELRGAKPRPDQCVDDPSTRSRR